MAISRYDTPAQAQFSNTYVPIPFNEMMKIGVMKQAAVESGDKAMNDAMANLSSFQVAPFDEQNYLEVRQNYENKLQDLYSKTGGAGDYEFRRGVARIRTEMGMDPLLRGMQYNLGQYQTAMKNKEQATEAGATRPNTYALDSSIQKMFAQEGTKGMMERTGSSKWVPGNWRKNVDIDPGFKTFVDDVIKSTNAVKGFQTDASGKYVVSSEKGGRSLAALAKPFGIDYKKIVNSKTGGISLKPVFGEEYSKTMNDFFLTPEGEQLIVNAAYGASSAEDAKDKAVDMYKRKVTKTINEFVSVDSKYSIDYDPLYEAAAKKKISDSQMQIVQKQAVGIPESKFKNAENVNEERQHLMDKVDEVAKRREDYLRMNGVLDSKAIYKDEKGVYQGLNLKKDVDEREVSLVLQEFDAEEAQVRRTQESLERMYKKAVRSTKVNGAFLKENWKPEDSMSEERIQDATNAAERRFKALNMSIGKTGYESTYKSGNLDMTKLTPEGKQQYKTLLDEELNSRSPAVKAIDATLAKNAEASSVLVGVSNLPSIKDEKYLEDKFSNWVVEGGDKLGGGSIRVRRFDTGEEITDPKELASFTSGKLTGITYDPTDLSPQLVFRPNISKKKGEVELAPYSIMIDAPQGVEATLAKAGWTNELEIALRNQLVDVENNIADEGTIGRGEDQLTVRKLTPSEKLRYPQNVNFTITAKGQGGKQEPIIFKDYPTTDIGSIIRWYTRTFLPAQEEVSE